LLALASSNVGENAQELPFSAVLRTPKQEQNVLFLTYQLRLMHSSSRYNNQSSIKSKQLTVYPVAEFLKVETIRTENTTSGS